jgi:hypothetical protein
MERLESMKTHTAGLTIAVLALSAVAGCNGVKVWTEYDPTTDFSNLTTYGWATIAPTAPIDPETETPILDARVRLAIENELAARGFQKQASGPPDFLVGYRAVVEQKVDVGYVDQQWGYSYTYRARAPRKTVYEYEEGTLILDVSLPDPRRLIWRGIARAEVYPGRSQEEGDRRLAEAVRKMFDQFPAKGPVAQEQPR